MAASTQSSQGISKNTIQASEHSTTPQDNDYVSCNIFFILRFDKQGKTIGDPIATKKTPIRLTLGKGELSPFFEECLRQSKIGERNEFTIDGAHPLFKETAVWNGFDELVTDREHFVAKPQDYCISVEIEVCRVEPSRQAETPNIFELTAEEKRTRAEALKKQGDEEFKAGNFQAAADTYTKAYKLVFFEDGKIFNELKFKIGSNLAFMNLKLKRYEDCINMNDQFIRFGYPVTDKTFFRNGQAAESYGRFEEAIKYYQRAIETSNDEEYKKNLETAIAAVKKKITGKEDQMRKNMQKMWGS